MTGEQELLLALLRGELTGTAAELDEKTLREADWDAVLKESQAQAVTLMAADALAPFGKYRDEHRGLDELRGAAYAGKFCAFAKRGVAGERDRAGTDGDFKGYVRCELLL